jgi:hypothetical protein
MYYKVNYVNQCLNSRIHTAEYNITYMQIIYDNDDKYNNHCAKTKEKSSSCSSFISGYDIDEKAIDKIKKVGSHQSDNYDDNLGLSDI